MAAATDVSTMTNTNENQNLGERTNDSGISGGDSAAADGTGVSLSASAYDVIQQYSEAELHGEYEEQYFGFTADSVADNCKFHLRHEILPNEFTGCWLQNRFITGCYFFCVVLIL